MTNNNETSRDDQFICTQCNHPLDERSSFQCIHQTGFDQIDHSMSTTVLFQPFQLLLNELIHQNKQLKQDFNQLQQQNQFYIEQINQQSTSIQQLQQKVNQMRTKNIEQTNQINQLQNDYQNLNQQLLEVHQCNDLLGMKIKSIQKYINHQQLIIPNLTTDQRWKQHATTIGGGHKQGNQLNQLSYPCGMFVDDAQTIYVADTWNHRIVEWKKNAIDGRIAAGGNGQGNRNDQLNHPKKVIVDKQNRSLIICDSGNRRVVRWPRRNGQSGQTIISNIVCWDVSMDNDGYLYVSDTEKHEVRRWKIGEMEGTLVAGGNGRGNRLDQLDRPTNIFIDEDQSVYVSDCYNHRVMKWVKDAKEGTVIAGGQGEGDGLRQLSNFHGIIVDQLSSVYVADGGNHRVVRWLEGAAEGSIIVGGNGKGEQPDQFSYPADLSFDRENNLYVVDYGNHRVQKFEVNN